jgi:hypothetical protein
MQQHHQSHQSLPPQPDTSGNSTKRQAKIGQWRTPPTPAFLPSPSNINTNTILDDIPIPESSDDYAIALQEAYRRGAQAAAAISSQSCPDLIKASIPTSVQSKSNMNSLNFPPPIPEEPLSSNMAAPTMEPSSKPFYSSFPSAANATMTISTVANPLAQQQSLPHQHQPALQTSSLPPTQALMSSTTSHPPQTVSIPSSSVSAANRSVSLPDINSYAKRAVIEEDKRQKRLARNRASARLRRLKKKNLVDSYEAEVGVLETSLAKLRDHRWGIGTDINALLEALSMDRGQQKMDPEKRKELITSILTQQSEQVHNVLECQMENYLLKLLASDDLDTEEDKEFSEMTNELKDVLQLTPQQCQKLRESTKGIEEEMKAIDTIESCLSELLNNSWLMNQGVEESTEPFMSILNQGQISKFLLWTDHNSDAIESLDYLHVSPSSPTQSQHQNQVAKEKEPTFFFGVDEAEDTTAPASVS